MDDGIRCPQIAVHRWASGSPASHGVPHGNDHRADQEPSIPPTAPVHRLAPARRRPAPRHRPRPPHAGRRRLVPAARGRRRLAVTATPPPPSPPRTDAARDTPLADAARRDDRGRSPAVRRRCRAHRPARARRRPRPAPTDRTARRLPLAVTRHTPGGTPVRPAAAAVAARPPRRRSCRYAWRGGPGGRRRDRGVRRVDRRGRRDQHRSPRRTAHHVPAGRAAGPGRRPGIRRPADRHPRGGPPRLPRRRLPALGPAARQAIPRSACAARSG